MQIRFNNGIVVEFPKGTPMSTIDAVERAISLPKPERDRVLRKAKLTVEGAAPSSLSGLYGTLAALIA